MPTKSVQCNGERGNYFGITLTYVENSTNTTTNTSNVTITGTLKATTAGYSYYGATNTGTLKIDGTQVATGSSTATVDTSGVTLFTYTGDITHNSDGKKTASLEFVFTTTYGRLSETSLTASWTLTTIPRASTISLTTNTMTLTNTTDTLGYTVTSQGNFYHKLTWKVGSSTTTIWTKQSINNTTRSGTITASAILNKLPSATSGTVIFTLTTYSDSAGTIQTGTATASCNVTVDTTVIKPTISLGNISLDQPSSIGKLVAGYTTAKVTCTTTNSAGASSYTVRFTTTKGSLATVTATSSPVTVSTNTLPSSTSNYTFKITATVTDSRGVTATASKTSGTVYGYAKPVISASFYRTATNSSTSADPAGLYVYRAFSATQSYTLGGSNPVTVTAKQDGTTVSSGTWGSLSESDSATLVVTATDSVTSVTKRLTVGTAKFPIDLYDSGSGSVGVGLGATAIANRVRSALSLLFDNNVGVKGYDTSGNEVYVAIYNASNNLWIGARTNGMTHFTGKTYICTGYDSTSGAGNDSAFLAIPNSANDNVTYSKILHETFAPIAGYMTQNSWASGANDADNAPNGSTWCNCQYVDNLPFTSGYGYLVTIAKNLQFFVRFSSSGASGLYIRYYTNSQWYAWQQVSGGSSPSYTNGDNVEY